MDKSRKPIGLLMILVFLTIYCFGAMLVAVNFLPDSKWAEFIYYPIAGILWIFPIMKIINFMQPGEPEEDS